MCSLIKNSLLNTKKTIGSHGEIIGFNILDSTGGFKCININALKTINLDKIKSEGYSFQVEINFLSWVKGYKIKELPIIFTDRTTGDSKISYKIG